jgi:hypothetical protein
LGQHAVCFVSGHDFSRAVCEQKRVGLKSLRQNYMFGPLRNQCRRDERKSDLSKLGFLHPSGLFLFG